MPSPLRQASFVAGETAPGLHERADLEMYRAALKTCKNFIVEPQGGVVNRPGTEFVRAAGDSTAAVRLIPFVFNEDQTYVLEFGDEYVRFHTAGGTVMDPSAPTNPLEVATPYVAADLFRIRFEQINDVLYLVHSQYSPRKLTRYDHDDWRLSAYSISRVVLPPTSVTATGPGSDTTHPDKRWEWVVTSVDSEGRESLPSDAYVDTAACVYIDKDPTAVSWTAPTSGNTPVLYNVYRGRNGYYGFVGSSDTNSFVDEGYVPAWGDSPPEGRDPFSIPEPPTDPVDRSEPFDDDGTATGGSANSDAEKSYAAEAWDDSYTFVYSVTLSPGETAEVLLQTRVGAGGSWTTQKTKVYANLIGSVDKTFNASEVVNQDGIDGDSAFRLIFGTTSGSPSIARDYVAWTESLGTTGSEIATYPAAISLFEQRLVFGGFDVAPNKLIASRTGDLENFDQSRYVKDDDALEFVLASGRLDAIRSLVPFRSLLAFTAGAQWALRGTDGGPLTPSSFDIRPQSYAGSSWVPPIRVVDVALFVQNGGRTVRELVYKAETDSVQAKDLTVLARHLFKGHTVVDWAYAAEPDGILWVVRDDGVLLGLTYLREHEVAAWHRHDTDGTVESVAVVPESGEDAVYLLVNRTINGSTVRYIERMASREITDLTDAVFVDSALSWDGTNTDATSLLALSGGSTWTAGEALTLTSSGAGALTFTAGDVGDEFRITSGSDTARVEVIAYTSASVVQVRAINNVPTALQSGTHSTWARATKSFSGAGHLEGETVTVVADGFVQTPVAVSSGAITIASRAVKVTVGLPYTSRLETVELVSGDSEIREKRKVISKVSVKVESSRGLWVGPDEDNMVEWRQRRATDNYSAITPSTELIELTPHSDWRVSGGIVIEQRDPMPLRVLALFPRVQVGG